MCLDAEQHALAKDTPSLAFRTEVTAGVATVMASKHTARVKVATTLVSPKMNSESVVGHGTTVSGTATKERVEFLNSHSPPT